MQLYEWSVVPLLKTPVPETSVPETSVQESTKIQSPTPMKISEADSSCDEEQVSEGHLLREGKQNRMMRTSKENLGGCPLLLPYDAKW